MTADKVGDRQFLHFDDALFILGHLFFGLQTNGYICKCSFNPIVPS